MRRLIFAMVAAGLVATASTAQSATISESNKTCVQIKNNRMVSKGPCVFSIYMDAGGNSYVYEYKGKIFQTVDLEPHQGDLKSPYHTHIDLTRDIKSLKVLPSSTAIALYEQNKPYLSCSKHRIKKWEICIQHNGD